MDASFWKRVEKSDSCWVWTGTIHHKTGYGMLKRAHIRWLAHRFAYTDSIGPIPDGLVVRHKCDNRPCCNPAHLELGTQKDNIHDAIKRGRRRYLFGEQNPHSKLTNAQREEIRQLPRSERQAAIAMRYGISGAQVSAIRGPIGPPPRGESHHHAKLNWDKVDYIRQSRETTANLARELGVDPATVSNVRLGKSWKR